MLKQQPSNIAELVESALTLIDDPDQRARVQVTVEPRLPTASADRKEIEQALSRLLLAALSIAGEKAPVALHIGPVGRPAPSDEEDASRPEATAVRLSIQAAEMEGNEEALAPLFGASGGAIAQARDSGRHLGVAVARALIEMHGGKVWLEDGGDRGAAICFSLPAYQARAGGPAVIVAGGGSGSEAPEGPSDGQDHDRGRRPVRTTVNAG